MLPLVPQQGMPLLEMAWLSKHPDDAIRLNLPVLFPSITRVWNLLTDDIVSVDLLQFSQNKVNKFIITYFAS